jgi:hypothetical protein
MGEGEGRGDLGDYFTASGGGGILLFTGPSLLNLKKGGFAMLKHKILICDDEENARAALALFSAIFIIMSIRLLRRTLR